MSNKKNKNLNLSREHDASDNKNVSIDGDVIDSVVIVGDKNITNFQKIINIFKSESESLDHRNRRVMLNHVENFWVKGVLEKSLHGVALLELGIKEDPAAINYPWAIKRESTNETLPVGKPMLEIFNEIGSGRSLLILGAPGSGKTTMLLELTRQLIQRARNDATDPLPVVFNLSSWTEKQSLADWLVEQLNLIYSIPRKTAPEWVSENKMLLLLDGLDEVREESREKCVEAINKFRNEHGLTSLVVCSRIEEYGYINTKLSLDGAITIQPLTPEQVDNYFDKFGSSLASVRKLLKSDETLQELTKTPLMLSVMTLAYKDKKPDELLDSKNMEEGREYLFNTYVERMFDRPTRQSKSLFSKKETLQYLSWLALKMIQHNIVTYQTEIMKPAWLDSDKQRYLYKWIIELIVGLIIGLIGGLFSGVIGGLLGGVVGGLFVGMVIGLDDVYQVVKRLRWPWIDAQNGLVGGLLVGLFSGLIVGLFGRNFEILGGLIGGLNIGLLIGLLIGLFAGQRLGWDFGVLGGYWYPNIRLIIKLIARLFDWVEILFQRRIVWNIFIRNNILPLRIVTFLEYSVDLIFLRRVGGSYIFVHRLLMEHFAEMYIEKENK